MKKVFSEAHIQSETALANNRIGRILQEPLKLVVGGVRRRSPPIRGHLSCKNGSSRVPRHKAPNRLTPARLPLTQTRQL